MTNAATRPIDTTMTHALDDRGRGLFFEPPHDHIEVEGGRVAYRRMGQGPDVLFVHGWPVHSATYRELAPHLAKGFTCHFIDLLGAGASQWREDTTFTLSTHIDSVRRVVDELGLKSVALVGQDSGGLIARHAMAGDERLRGLGLCGTELPPTANWRFKQFLIGAKLPGFGAMLAWAANQQTLRRHPMVLGGCFADQERLDGEFTTLFLEPLRTDARRRRAAVELARHFDLDYVHKLDQVHARLDVPVALVCGERDPFFPVAQARVAIATFPDANLHVIPRAKLMVHEEFPEQVAEAMWPALLGREA